PEGWSAWFYSITLNGASALATGAFTIMVLAVIARTNPQLLVPKKSVRGY
ncbi:energy-coupled thiamine transporter ThiT, partial [Trichococcus sp.]